MEFTVDDKRRFLPCRALLRCSTAAAAGVVSGASAGVLASALVGAMVLAPAALASEAAVGEVSLLIGSARVSHRGGAAQDLRRGAAVRVGDRIETAANGHVHVRFVDNASVSVRPDSVLVVQAYRYDAGNPQGNEVRLSVEQGTSRSISGQATEVDKNRFRLNTPLAAIGVRGTDFIVQTTDQGVRATVADGAIVVGALGGACSAAGLGPCTGAAARELSADMGRLMVEVRRGDDMARLVPQAGNALLAAGAASDERLGAQRGAEAARAGGQQAAELTYASKNDRAAADLLVIAQASVPDLNRPSDPNAQLAWGRYSVGAPTNDAISMPYALARVGREYTTGDGDFTLWRRTDAGASESLLQSNEASVDFRLTRAQATYEAGGKSEAASVNGGTLNVDFARRTFATALALSSTSGGQAELRVAGTVLSDGKFGAKDAEQKVTGALALDGSEAGYLFERNANGGLFKGKTLWGR
jgi:hypothetical protein